LNNQRDFFGDGREKRGERKHRWQQTAPLPTSRTTQKEKGHRDDSNNMTKGEFCFLSDAAQGYFCLLGDDVHSTKRPQAHP
jgi:hypothetical protein